MRGNREVSTALTCLVTANASGGGKFGIIGKEKSLGIGCDRSVDVASVVCRAITVGSFKFLLGGLSAALQTGHNSTRGRIESSSCRSNTHAA